MPEKDEEETNQNEKKKGICGKSKDYAEDNRAGKEDNVKITSFRKAPSLRMNMIESAVSFFEKTNVFTSDWEL